MYDVISHNIAVARTFHKSEFVLTKIPYPALPSEIWGQVVRLVWKIDRVTTAPRCTSFYLQWYPALPSPMLWKQNYKPNLVELSLISVLCEHPLSPMGLHWSKLVWLYSVSPSDLSEMNTPCYWVYKHGKCMFRNIQHSDVISDL